MANPTFSKDGFIVIGDSITAPRNSWANKMRDRTPDKSVMLDAMSGRFITRYMIPSDWSTLYSLGDYGTVVYFLGMNDLIQGEAFPEIETRLRSQLSAIKATGFMLRFVLLPGCAAMAQKSAQYRLLIRNIALDYADTLHDSAEIWDSNRLFDGVHPDESLQADIADWAEAQGIFS